MPADLNDVDVYIKSKKDIAPRFAVRPPPDG